MPVDARQSSQVRCSVGLGAGDAPASARGSRCASTLPARFEMLYASRDGKLCLFETKEGHLSAVDASKLA